MKAIETHGTFEEVIRESSPEVQAIARYLRQLIIDIYPEVTEVPWPKQGIAGYGVGPKKMSEHFCYIGTQSNRVNLEFFPVRSCQTPRLCWKELAKSYAT